LPAQTFYLSLPTLLPILRSIPTVIFYCGSSSGRGPRCAGWYADALEAVVGPENMAGRVKVLEGGIKAWSAAEDPNGERVAVLPVSG
jgi:arsenical-resistance protein 2